MISSFDTLAEVAFARDLLRRWWGLELGLADPAALDKRGTVRFAAAVDALGATAVASVIAALKTVKQPGIVDAGGGVLLIAAPVMGDKGIAGIVYATGLRSGDVTAAPAGVTPTEASQLQVGLTALSPSELERARDLVIGAASAVERAQPAVIPPTTNVHPFTEIVGDAPAVRDVVKLLTKIVRSEATVLIHGESGTGKELIARAIHYHGPRAKKPFVVQNCSAFNDNLLESALFGHVRGAFTGAVKDQPGLFQVADGGTFFLDEIGDMSAALQVKLLRVLQEGTLMPVGGTKAIKVDVRIIAASHKDLAHMVQHKMFREDLFYRVNVLKITVPPLRERVADIPRLAQHFITKHWRSPGSPPKLSQGALSRLVAYPWPGNIRELENEMERMLVLAGDAQELTAGMISARVAGIVDGAQSAPRPLRDVIATAETEVIVSALGRHLGDRAAAAADLDVSGPYLDARIVTLGLDHVP